MKHQAIPTVPIAVAHLSNASNPTRNDNPNCPSPMFVVAQNSPRCTRLVLSLRFIIPLVVAQKSPCCGDLSKSGSGHSYPAADREGRAPARPKLPRGRIATCCDRMVGSCVPPSPRLPPPRFALWRSRRRMNLRDRIELLPNLAHRDAGSG